jgi:hypothetical protein
MSAITNVLRQLKERRLWPVAILLVAALAAVPIALAKEPAAAPPAPPTTADTGDDVLASQPIVAAATASDRAKRRKVLGTRKNPFAVTKELTGSETPPSSDGANEANDPATGSGSNPASTPVPSSGGTTSPGTGTPSPTTPGTPVAPPKVFAPNSLTVRFGDDTGSVRKTVKRLQPLPSLEAPVAIYLGVSGDGKSAIFLVDEGVEAVGDGECDPAPDKCETFKLKAGETEFLDVKDETGNVVGQYQLDLIKIHRATASSARKRATRAKASRLLAGAASAGAVRGTVGLKAVTGL